MRNGAAKIVQFVRYAICAVSGVALIALVALWYRSYQTADQLHGAYWGRESFLLASKEGRVAAVLFRWHGAANWWSWRTLSYPVDDALSFPIGPVRQYQSALGFGWVNRPLYYVMRPTYTTPDGVEVLLLGAASASLQGAGPIIPYWFLVLACGALIGALLVRFWRFSLRGMLIATGFIAVVLALVVAFDI